MSGGNSANREVWRASARSGLVWGLRLLLLSVAAGAVLVAFSQSSSSKHPIATFVCPMHPRVRASLPGRCPVCDMALIPAEEEDQISRGAEAAISPVDLATVRAVRFFQPPRAPAWIDADGSVVALLYRDEAEGLEPGAPATFLPALSPITARSIRLEDVPPRAWDETMVELRFRFDREPGSRPAEVGRVALSQLPRPVLVVEENLVLAGDGGRYVLVPSRDGRSFERRRVELGRVVNGRAVIVVRPCGRRARHSPPRILPRC